VVALCTEFPLILLRFIEERQRYAPGRHRDHRRAPAGRSSCRHTAVSGVAVIAFSSLPAADFGMIVAMNVAVALLSALVFPPMLVGRRAGLGHGVKVRHDVRSTPTARCPSRSAGLTGRFCPARRRLGGNVTSTDRPRVASAPDGSSRGRTSRRGP
jgi:hypothetical protein